MKKFVLNLVFLGTLIVQAQDRIYYYDEWGGKVYLQKEDSVKIVQFAEMANPQNNRLLSDLRSQNIKVDAINPFIAKYLII